MTYETEIVWRCTCGESGTIPLLHPDDDGKRIGLLMVTHRSQRGCELTTEVRKRS